MTTNTTASDCSGSFRIEDEPVFVQDHIDGEIAYIAPIQEFRIQMQNIGIHSNITLMQHSCFLG